MSDVIEAGPRPSLAVEGEAGRFPIRRVFCIGRNYAEHAREMGHDDREPPFYFEKATEAVTSASEIPYPPLTNDLHHEIELVVAIGTAGADIAPADAPGHIYGYAVGVDLTRRDLQAEAKKLARPWAPAKSWRGAAPTGPVWPASRIGHPRKGRIWLEVDGEVRQDSDLQEMIWSVDEIVATLSRYDRLEPGDLVFTGTPAGVGRLRPGCTVTGGVEGVGAITFKIAG